MPTFETERSRPLTQESHSQIRKIEERMDVLSSHLEELTKLINLKTEKVAIKQKTLEERQEEMIQDFQKRLIAVITKSAELPKLEVRIQELIERQNHAMRNFESRMNHFRKITENHESQLFRVLTEVEELRREIARLKRL